MEEDEKQKTDFRRQNSEDRGYRVEGEKMGGNREIGTGNAEGGKNRTKL
jgi:hypothetical protein